MDVVWTAAALGDVDRIQDFIAQDNPAAAFRLATALIGRTNIRLQIVPRSGRKGRAPGTFELVVPGTPYIVVYRIDERVEIVAVVHSAREWPASFDAP